MNIVCLNIWGGRAGKELLLDFFKTHAESTDIFCLQEVWAERYDHLEGKLAGGKVISNDHIMTHALQDIGAVLSEHTAYFRPSFLQHYGQCMFVKKSISVLYEGDEFVFEERGFMPPEDEVGLHARNVQYMTVEHNGAPVTVMNFHGLWNGKGKGDCAEREAQSERLSALIRARTEPVVLIGDFNLMPDTQSLKMIEDSGLRNLISEYGITSTRTSLYDKPETYADYAFVSEGIEVKEFKILPEEVSDHAPLFLSIA